MDLDYEPDESDGVDPAYMYQNEHIFEPEKEMLEWAVNSLKTPLGQYIDLDSRKTIEDLQVIVRAGWWVHGQEKLKESKVYGH